MISNCPETAEGVARVSAPQHQQHGNPPSQKYVPPAGTTGPRVGFGHAAVDSTPASTGAQLAAAVFGVGARSANDFQAMGLLAMAAPVLDEPEVEPVITPVGPTESPQRKRAPGLEFPHHRTIWDQAIGGYSAAVGISSLASNFCTTLTSVLAVGAAYKGDNVPSITAAEVDHALAAMSPSTNLLDVYFLDSACSFSIASNTTVMVNVHNIEPRVIEGLTGSRTFKQAGTMVPNTLLDPLATVNLIAAKQLNNLGYTVLFLPEADNSSIVAPMRFWNDGVPLCLLIVQRNNVFLLTPMEADTSKTDAPTAKFAFPAVSKYAKHLLEELLHQLYIHAPTDIMCHMNRKVKGLPRAICNTRVTHASHCSGCAEANSVHQNYPDASTTVHSTDSDLWQWDMLDMGADYETLQGNSYATLFVVKQTRFLMAFLHSSKDRHVIADMMCKALAKMGSWPTHMRSYGEAKYNSP
eukprot:2080525-Rhodomonas_salina.1